MPFLCVRGAYNHLNAEYRQCSDIPRALIILPGQLIPPAIQKSEGSQLLRVENLLLLLVHVHVRLLCEDWLHIFLNKGGMNE